MLFCYVANVVVHYFFSKTREIYMHILSVFQPCRPNQVPVHTVEILFNIGHVQFNDRKVHFTNLGWKRVKAIMIFVPSMKLKIYLSPACSL